MARVFAGGHGTLEFELIGSKGTRRWMETHAVPLRGADGEIVAALSVTRDVTERKRLEEQLRQSQKMEAVGRLAGGVAHDFNNLLTVILGYADAAAQAAARRTIRCRGDARGDRASAAERAAALTRQLLAFSRRQVLAAAGARPQRGRRRAWTTMLRRLIGEDIELVTATAPGRSAACAPTRARSSRCS